MLNDAYLLYLMRDGCSVKLGKREIIKRKQSIGLELYSMNIIEQSACHCVPKNIDSNFNFRKKNVL